MASKGKLRAELRRRKVTVTTATVVAAMIEGEIFTKRMSFSPTRRTKKRSHLAHLAIPARRALFLGKRPASSYHKNIGRAFATCGGICSNRICSHCSFNCERCEKSVCGSCMSAHSGLCLGCEDTDDSVVGLDSECYDPEEQDLARASVQKPRAARRLVFESDDEDEPIIDFLSTDHGEPTADDRTCVN
jgi:hypothetical protein